MTVGDLFIGLLIVLWIIWTIWTIKMFVKYRVEFVKDAPEISFLEGFWWVLNVILPCLIAIFSLGVYVAELVVNNWDTVL